MILWFNLMMEADIIANTHTKKSVTNCFKLNMTGCLQSGEQLT